MSMVSPPKYQFSINKQHRASKHSHLLLAQHLENALLGLSRVQDDGKVIALADLSTYPRENGQV